MALRWPRQCLNVQVPFVLGQPVHGSKMMICQSPLCCRFHGENDAKPGLHGNLETWPKDFLYPEPKNEETVFRSAVILEATLDANRDLQKAELNKVKFWPASTGVWFVYSCLLLKHQQGSLLPQNKMTFQILKNDNCLTIACVPCLLGDPRKNSRTVKRRGPLAPLSSMSMEPKSSPAAFGSWASGSNLTQGNFVGSFCQGNHII